MVHKALDTVLDSHKALDFLWHDNFQAQLRSLAAGNHSEAFERRSNTFLNWINKIGDFTVLNRTVRNLFREPVQANVRPKNFSLRNILRRDRKVQRPGYSGTHWNNHLLSMIEAIVAAHDEQMSLCATKDLLGWGHPRTELGEEVAILQGCTVPVVLRRFPNKSVETFRVVGDAYVRGAMLGEFWRGVNHGKQGRIYHIV